jgi:hypothetical protein
VKASLAELLAKDDTLSELAVLKQDARDFGWQQMARGRDKRTRLQPLYRPHAPPPATATIFGLLGA